MERGEEVIPLLTASAKTDEILRKGKWATFIGAVALTSLLFLAWAGNAANLREKVVGETALDANPSIDNTILSDMKYVFDVVTNWNESKFVVCPDATFAYCGEATCTIADKKTAVCGCEMRSGVDGLFDIGKGSLILIKSALFRRAIFAVEEGTFDSMKTEFCDAARDGSLFKSAGFETSLGSYFYENVTSTTTSSAPAFANSLIKAENQYMKSAASCMGAPCKTYDWGSDCSTTCACNYCKFLSKNILERYWDSIFAKSFQTDEESSSEPATSCFRNTALNQDRSYGFTSSLATLLLYTKSASGVIEDLDDIMDKLKVDGSVCGGECSVTSCSLGRC